MSHASARTPSDSRPGLRGRVSRRHAVSGRRPDSTDSRPQGREIHPAQRAGRSSSMRTTRRRSSASTSGTRSARRTRSRAGPGFAHLFEHLMFQGSQHHDNEYFGPLEKIGAEINGSTNTDRTNYFETAPEQCAWSWPSGSKSDRMGFLLPALTQAKLDNQRDVVKNERRQRVDNVPVRPGARDGSIEALYPPDHPYHHSVIGSMADLSAASLGRRLGVLPHLLQPEQRQPRASPATSTRRDQGSSSRSTSARSRAGRGRQARSPRCRSLPSRSISR